MRSRSALEHAGVALAAIVEATWIGALAAALSGASWTLSAIFAAITVAFAAHLTRWAGSEKRRERAARLRAVVLILVATGVLLAAGRSWEHQYFAWQVARDVVYVGGLVLLGIRLGQDVQTPEAAVRRALRAFALLCATLVCAALTGLTPGWAAWAVTAALVAGGLFIAVVRYQSLTDLVDEADRLSIWPSLLVVAGAVLGVIAVGALLSQVLSLDVLHWAFDLLGSTLRYGLDGLAYVIGWAGAGLLRALEWVLGLVHLRAQRTEPPSPLVAPPRYVPGHTTQSSATLRLALTAGVVVVALGIAVAVVALALRRLDRRGPAEDAVMEEREALTSLRSATKQYAAALGRRLRRRLQKLRRRGPATPAEIVRQRYRDLERRLERAGRPRLPGVTVRAHLAAVAASLAAATAAVAAAAGSPTTAANDQPDAAALAQAAADTPDPTALAQAAVLTQAAADLAATYELARYSVHSVELAQAHEFEALARAFRA